MRIRIESKLLTVPEKEAAFSKTAGDPVFIDLPHNMKCNTWKCHPRQYISK